MYIEQLLPTAALKSKNKMENKTSNDARKEERKNERQRSRNKNKPATPGHVMQCWEGIH